MGTGVDSQEPCQQSLWLAVPAAPACGLLVVPAAAAGSPQPNNPPLRTPQNSHIWCYRQPPGITRSFYRIGGKLLVILIQPGSHPGDRLTP